MVKILALKKSKLDLLLSDLIEGLDVLIDRGVLIKYSIKGDDLRLWVDATRAEMLLATLDHFEEYNLDNRPIPKRRSGD